MTGNFSPLKPAEHGDGLAGARVAQPAWEGCEDKAAAQSSSQQAVCGGRDGCERSLHHPACCSSSGTEGARTELSHGEQ